MEVISHYTLDNILIFSTKYNIYVYDIIESTIKSKYPIQDEKYSRFNIDNSCGSVVLIPLSGDSYICGDIFNENTYTIKNFTQKEKDKIDSNITFMVKLGKVYYIAVGKKLITFNNCKSGFTIKTYEYNIESFIKVDNKLYIIDSERNLLHGKSIYSFGNLENLLKKDRSLLFNYKTDKIVSLTKITEEHINIHANKLNNGTRNEVTGKYMLSFNNNNGYTIQDEKYQYIILDEGIPEKVGIYIKDEWVVFSYIVDDGYGYLQKRNIIIRINDLGNGDYFTRYGLFEHIKGNIVILKIINQDINKGIYGSIINGPYSLHIDKNDKIELNKV